MLDGKERLGCPVDPAIVCNEYRRIWERGDPYKGLGQFGGSLPMADNTPFMVPFLASEGVVTLKNMDQDGTSGVMTYCDGTLRGPRSQECSMPFW